MWRRGIMSKKKKIFKKKKEKLVFFSSILTVCFIKIRKKIVEMPEAMNDDKKCLHMSPFDDKKKEFQSK